MVVGVHRHLLHELRSVGQGHQQGRRPLAVCGTLQGGQRRQGGQARPFPAQAVGGSTQSGNL